MTLLGILDVIFLLMAVAAWISYEEVRHRYERRLMALEKQFGDTLAILRKLDGELRNPALAKVLAEAWGPTGRPDSPDPGATPTGEVTKPVSSPAVVAPGLYRFIPRIGKPGSPRSGI